MTRGLRTRLAWLFIGATNGCVTKVNSLERPRFLIPLCICPGGLRLDGLCRWPLHQLRRRWALLLFGLVARYTGHTNTHEYTHDYRHTNTDRRYHGDSGDNGHSDRDPLADTHSHLVPYHLALGP